MLHQEVHVTAVHLLAAALWVASFTIWALAWATDTAYLAELAIIVSVAAATACARGFLLTHEEQMKTALLVTGRSGEVTPLDR